MHGDCGDAARYGRGLRAASSRRAFFRTRRRHLGCDGELARCGGRWPLHGVKLEACHTRQTALLHRREGSLGTALQNAPAPGPPELSIAICRSRLHCSHNRVARSAWIPRAMRPNNRMRPPPGDAAPPGYPPPSVGALCTSLSKTKHFLCGTILSPRSMFILSFCMLCEPHGSTMNLYAVLTELGGCGRGVCSIHTRFSQRATGGGGRG